MNRDAMARMSEKDIDEYASFLGIQLADASSVDEKIALIERRRERCVSIPAMGCTFSIPIKHAHDKRIIDLMEKDHRSDDETYEVMELLLGSDQMAELLSACTDEDGVIDIDALGIAFVKIITSEQLKNF